VIQEAISFLLISGGVCVILLGVGVLIDCIAALVKAKTKEA